ncbi:MAG: NUDIX domain-containing protein [Alphaproteobacteria bacterium]|nr:MAG: hypothetical protein B6I23_03260 [Rickettsiaceae bacterium 4572_127]
MQKIYCGSHGVIKKDNKILLGIRNKKTSGSFGRYFTIGGTLEFLETTENCLHREVKEETNIEIENVKFFKHYDYLNTDKKIAPHRIVFIVKPIKVVRRIAKIFRGIFNRFQWNWV